jgi:tetrahydromethanopterin S-methyltransferase subunit E
MAFQTSSSVILLVLLVLVAALSLNQVTAFVPATPSRSVHGVAKVTAVLAKPASSKEEDLELTRKVIQSHLESDASSSSSSSDQKTATATAERTEES